MKARYGFILGFFKRQAQRILLYYLHRTNECNPLIE
jgi:hypothetical protein